MALIWKSFVSIYFCERFLCIDGAGGLASICFGSSCDQPAGTKQGGIDVGKLTIERANDVKPKRIAEHAVGEIEQRGDFLAANARLPIPPLDVSPRRAEAHAQRR